MRVFETIPDFGATLDWDIEEILERPSIDVKRKDWQNIADTWADVLEDKRNDYNYQDIVTSLRTWGFVRPLTARVADGQLQFGDGHHRLAASIELGWAVVPVVVRDGWVVSQDSGCWNLRNGIDVARNMA